MDINVRKIIREDIIYYLAEQCLTINYDNVRSKVATEIGNTVTLIRNSMLQMYINFNIEGIYYDATL